MSTSSAPGENRDPQLLPDAYPAAERLDLVEVLHGRPVADPYRRLEDAAAEQTARWSELQDRLYAAFRESWLDEAGAGALRARLAALADAGYAGPPVPRRKRAFHLRRAPGQDHGVLLVRDEDGTERVLLDPVALDPSGLTTLDSWRPDEDGRLLAYVVSEAGTEQGVLRVIDVDSGELVDGPIDRTNYTSVAWLPDGTAFYYARRLAPDAVPDGESQYHRRVYLHRIGTDPAEDVLVFGDGLEKTNYYGVGISPDGRWLTVTVSAGTAPRNDAYLADLSAAEGDVPRFRTVQEGVDAQTHPYFGRDGRCYLFTDRDAANARLCVADPDALGYEHWHDVVAEDPSAVLADLAVLDGDELARPLILALHSRHAVSELSLFDLETGERVGAVETPGDGTIAGLYEHPDGGPLAWFGYTDHRTPDQVYSFDARTGEVRLWAPSPGGVELGAVEVRRESYTSPDGTEVQLTVLSPTGEPDRPRPTILYGYGGFDVSLMPVFSALRLAWVEAGGVFAIANLRGGGEEGQEWHRAGMLGNKQNVFDDFHAAGDHLVSQGWTTRGQLGIFGGSNGGLLVGAALTQRPDAYAAVVCSAPLLDMVRYELFGLGASWAVEYGTAENAEDLGWLLAYSPYHNVREGAAYPATMFTVFEGDTRVDTLHARKLAAALQHATGAPVRERPILLRREQNVGHAARAVSKSVPLWVDQLAFFAHQLGLEIRGPAADAA